MAIPAVTRLRARLGPHGWPLLAILAAWLIYAGPLLSPASNLYLNDTYCIDVPIRIHAARLIRSGEFPHWTSNLHCGYPLFADSQAGVLYPLFAIYLLSPTPEAHDVFMAVHFFLLALFTYLYLVGERLSLAGSVIGAVTFMASSYHQSNHVIPGGLATVTWLPLALWMIRRTADGAGSAMWWCASVNAVMFLAGHAHAALACYSLEALWLIYCLGWSQRGRWFTAGAVVFLLPIALCALQVIPLQRFLAESTRASGLLSSELDQEELLRFRLHWKHLLTFFWPTALGTPFTWRWSDTDRAYQVPWWEALVVFQGFGAIALAPLAILWDRSRSVIRFWAFVALLALLWSGLMPFYWLLSYVPLYNLFRWPTRYMIAFSFAVAVLTAYGGDAVARLLTKRGPALRPAAIRVAIMALVTVSIAGAVFHHFGGYLTSADFYQIHSPVIVTVANQQKHFRLVSVNALHGCWPADPVRLRQNAVCLPSDFNLLFGVANATHHDQGYAVGPRSMADLFQADNPNFLKLAAVTHLAYPEPIDANHPSLFADPIRAAKLPDDQFELLSTSPAYVYRYRNARPRAWMVYSATTIASKEDRLSHIKSPDFDPAVEAVVEKEIAPCGVPRQEPAVDCRQITQDRLDIRVRTSAPGLLVVADYHWPEIVATLDGQPIEVLRANHAFRAIQVPAGEHLISMHDRPSSFYAGLAVSAVALLLLIVGLWRAGTVRRCPEGASTEPMSEQLEHLEAVPFRGG
jgi:hypothetical protein